MIKTSNLTKLKQLDLFQVIKNILSFLNVADLSILMLQKVADELQTAFEAFDKAIIQARKTGYTELLYELDAARDEVYRGFVALLKSFLSLPFPEKAAAAKALLAIIEKYPYIPTLPLREETAAITNLLQDLDTPEAIVQINLLGMTDAVALIAAKNAEFETTYNQRTEKEALVEVEIGKKTRLALENAFRNVANAINGLEAAFGEEPYRTLSDQINREVARAQK